MSTKEQLLKRLESIPEDAIIAVPVLWTKASAEDAWEYMNDEALTLTDDQWEEVVNKYEGSEFYGDEDLIETIREVLEDEQSK